MHFYYETYHDAYAETLEDMRHRDRLDGGHACEPIRISAILNWIVAVSVALCAIVAAIQFLS